MLLPTRVFLDCVSAPLLSRAISLRLGPLALPSRATNTFRLADGTAEGLPRGGTLDFCGGFAVLRAPRPFSARDVRDVRGALAAHFSDEKSGAADFALPHEKSGAVEFALPHEKSGAADFSLFECSVPFPSRAAAGRREMRAARRAFALALSALSADSTDSALSALSTLSADSADSALSVLDASEFDATMSRVAEHSGAARPHFAPIAARAPFLPREIIAPKETAPPRFALAAFTASPETSAAGALARVVRAVRPRGALLVTFVDSARDAEALRLCARRALAKALEEERRDGVIVSEVMPAADCPTGGAASLLVELE